MGTCQRAVVAIVGLVAAAIAFAQPKPAARPRFEVASVKPCESQSGPGRHSVDIRVGPNSLTISCEDLSSLINDAYLSGDVHKQVQSNQQIDGAPNWLRDDSYSIEAKAATATKAGVLMGPMLQVLLEERFELKVHRQTRTVPAYDLIVGKSGSKVKKFDETCIPMDLVKGPSERERACRPGFDTNKSHTTSTWHFRGFTSQQFVEWMERQQLTTRIVNDLTGLSGRFDFEVTFQDPEGRFSRETEQEQFPEALEKQLGLKLRPTTEMSDQFLVLDHVERKPTAN